ncbi:MetQ/NlpA family ABC transporter substrate-binding protein, partial [Kitasatospora sp. NPDC004669]|uniref:MetQ/NlpA family ABC transporter substrate-binding protein n=1 Tax=Kitasatospora sp. NPDC004669 TaxID=3154555 RepID=UPI0033A924E1
MVNFRRRRPSKGLVPRTGARHRAPGRGCGDQVTGAGARSGAERWPTDIVSVETVHLEPLGLYSKKVKAITDLPDGS